MFLVVGGVGVLGINQFQSGIDVDMGKYYQMVIGLFLLMFAIS